MNRCLQDILMNKKLFNEQSLVEFNENLIDERHEEIIKINNDVLVINEIMKDLNNIVQPQSESREKTLFFLRTVHQKTKFF